MSYIITTQLTEDYFKKAQPLFESIARHWPGRFIPGFIDFTPEYYGEHYLMRRSDIFTFSKNYPKNRPNFVCPQGGEFIDLINCEDDDIIIQVDADTIMQRRITLAELEQLTPKDGQILALRGAKPTPTLYEVAKNLDFRNIDEFKIWNDHFEFAASFMVAKRKTFAMLKSLIIHYWPDILANCDHHAGIQWLISAVAETFLHVKILDNSFQCGEWYIDFDTTVKNKELYYNDKLVLFNHTKFN